ncbi:MAG: AHH domain-containing protein, partial [Acidobacteria bacterium]|nr:AHH domain-containing protein [Acidobacteriota bacterium]
SLCENPRVGTVFPGILWVFAQTLKELLKDAKADGTLVKGILKGKSTHATWKDVGTLLEDLKAVKGILNGSGGDAGKVVKQLETAAKELREALEVADEAIQLRAMGKLSGREADVVEAVELATQKLAKARETAKEVVPSLSKALEGNPHRRAADLQKRLGEATRNLESAANTLPDQLENRLETLARQLSGDAATNMHSAILGMNLNNPRKPGYYAPRPPGAEAAHLVPSGDWSTRSMSERAKEAITKAQAILADSGIDINDARNGFWATDSKQLGTHTEDFFLKLRKALDEAKARGPKAVEEALATMRQRVLGTPADPLRGTPEIPPEFLFSQKK